MATSGATPARRKRLSAEERRRTIVEAAREEFAKSGDIGATTTKAIAQRVGVSEAILYRYFDSKEDLFIEAVVESLRGIVEKRVGQIDDLPGFFTDEDQIAFTTKFFEEILEMMSTSLPLLGLVLFGEPATARKFYERCWRPSLDRLSAAWRGWYEGEGIEGFPDTDVAARFTFGICMAYGLDTRFGEPFDRRAAAEAMVHSAFNNVWLRASQMYPDH